MKKMKTTLPTHRTQNNNIKLSSEQNELLNTLINCKWNHGSNKTKSLAIIIEILNTKISLKTFITQQQLTLKNEFSIYYSSELPDLISKFEALFFNIPNEDICDHLIETTSLYNNTINESNYYELKKHNLIHLIYAFIDNSNTISTITKLEDYHILKLTTPQQTTYYKLIINNNLIPQQFQSLEHSLCFLISPAHHQSIYIIHIHQ